MTFEELKRLVARGESETVEFKRKVAHPEKVIKEIVAFANTSGGSLLVGVNDDRSIPGLKAPEGEAYVLNEAIKKYCRPRIDYREETIRISDKKAVVCYHIPPSKKRPHYVIEDVNIKQGIAFVRVEDQSVKASREVREIIRRSKRDKGVTFNFGDKEKLLLQYLEEHRHITLPEFMKLAQLPRRRASTTLVLLTLAKVLKVIPQGDGDLFMKHQWGH